MTVSQKPWISMATGFVIAFGIMLSFLMMLSAGASSRPRDRDLLITILWNGGTSLIAMA